MGNTGFLLLHGAGLGAWIWNDTAAYLQLPYIAVDFPYRNGIQAQRNTLSFDDYVQATISQASNLKPHNVVVVAHSLSGVVALRVAEQLGDRLAGFVAVGAAIPRNGGSYLSSLPFPQKTFVGMVMKFAGTQPPATAIRKGLCNDVPTPLADKVVQTFAAESRAVYTTPVGVTAPDVPRQYILLTRDKEFGLALEQTMAQNLGGAKAELDAGHLPMLSKPAELAAILNQFVAKL